MVLSEICQVARLLCWHIKVLICVTEYGYFSVILSCVGCLWATGLLPILGNVFFITTRKFAQQHVTIYQTATYCQWHISSTSLQGSNDVLETKQIKCMKINNIRIHFREGKHSVSRCTYICGKWVKSDETFLLHHFNNVPTVDIFQQVAFIQSLIDFSMPNKSLASQPY